VTPYRKGKWIEFLACLALRFKGYIPVARRFKSRNGEIDLIAIAPNKTLVAVEIKFRKTHLEAHQSITPHQQKRIKNTLNFFLSLNPKYHTYNLRFDVFFVTYFGFQHIKQAWIEG